MAGGCGVPRSYIEMEVVRQLIAQVPEHRIREAFDAALVAWVRLRDPFDLAVWVHIALCCIVGDACEHSTAELSEFCRMSVGKVQEVRAYLLQAGLVEREDAAPGPGPGRPRWRLVTGDVREESQG